jgi:hypothetical protein
MPLSRQQRPSRGRPESAVGERRRRTPSQAQPPTVPTRPWTLREPRHRVPSTGPVRAAIRGELGLLRRRPSADRASLYRTAATSPHLRSESASARSGSSE